MRDLLPWLVVVCPPRPGKCLAGAGVRHSRGQPWHPPSLAAEPINAKSASLASLAMPGKPLPCEEMTPISHVHEARPPSWGGW